MTQVTPPPTREVGYEAVNPMSGGLPGTPSWAFFTGGIMDQMEDVPQLAWPNNIKVYHKMRTDAQIDALQKSIMFPMFRLSWKIAPNGARDEVVEDVSSQLHLPIQGNNDPFILRGRKRFNFREYLRLAMLAPLCYGHMPFEIVGDVIADSLLWKLRRLAPRMPQTIAKFDVARDGGLNAIIQYDPTNIRGAPIPISQLVVHTWEKEGGNWAGRSMMRPLYKYWLLKDRMLRIDAIKNERFGAGIPTGTAPQGGDPADYQKLAASIRASENAGVGLPAGASIGVDGLRGALPDTLASIRMYDEQMARSWLLMVLQLGQTETGSRALGDTFADLFEDSIWAFVDWFTGITDAHVIEDIVDWNWGEDEQAPLLVAERDEEEPLAAADLANLIKSGALIVDKDMENWIRFRFSMPEYTGEDPLPTKPASETPPTPEPAPTPPAPAASAGDGPEAHQPDHPDHDQSSHGNRSTKTKSKKKASKPATVPSGREAKVTFVASSSQTLDKPKIGHRDPSTAEVRATVDFEKLQKTWEDQTRKLVKAWNSVRSQQIDALVAAVEAAAARNDQVGLVTIDTPVLGQDILIKHMEDAAASSIAEALKEAENQGVTLPDPKLSSLGTNIEDRAAATANLLANSMSDQASKAAITRYAFGVDPADVAAGVRDKLEALSDTLFNDQLGGALTQAQNAGRMSVMGQAEQVTIYASELLDTNTCEFCESNDETEYGSDMSRATSDYPTGGFVDCLGGPRCRGTLVAVYGEPDDTATDDGSATD